MTKHKPSCNILVSDPDTPVGECDCDVKYSKDQLENLQDLSETCHAVANAIDDVTIWRYEGATPERAKAITELIRELRIIKKLVNNVQIETLVEQMDKETEENEM
jgi:hypothetical protein